MYIKIGFLVFIQNMIYFVFFLIFSQKYLRHDHWQVSRDAMFLCTNKSKFALLSMTKNGQRLHLNWSGKPVRVNLFCWSLFRAFHCSSCIQWSVHFLCVCLQGTSDWVWARHLQRLALCLHMELFDIGLSGGIG